MVNNFSWIIPERLAGMGRPGHADTAWLRAQGVTAVLSLTERAPDGLIGFDLFHLPISDMTSPTLDQLHAAVEFLRRAVRGGGGAVAHCGAGFGRTGTVLAAFLVGEGASARNAVKLVRKLRPGSIETPEQELVILEYAELVGGPSE